MSTRFNGLILTKAEKLEKETLEANFSKLKDKTKEPEADKIRRKNLVNKFLYGVEDEIPRSELKKLIESNKKLVKEGKKPLQYPTRMDIYNDSELSKLIPQGMKEKFDDGEIFAVEQAEYLNNKKGKK